MRADSTVKSAAGFETLLANCNEDKTLVVISQGHTTVEDKLLVGNWFRHESVNWLQLAQDRLQLQVLVAVIMDLEFHSSARIYSPLERLMLFV
jgi:hypothetical protein